MLLLLSAVQMSMRQTAFDSSKDDDLTAIKEWLMEMKTEKMAKRLRREKWTKIALRVDRILLRMFTGLLVMATIATFIALIDYGEKREKLTALA